MSYLQPEFCQVVVAGQSLGAALLQKLASAELPDDVAPLPYQYLVGKMMAIGRVVSEGIYKRTDVWM